MNPHSNSVPPPYFKLNGPGHFYVRTDLLDELCYKDALENSLPTDKPSHTRWLHRHGLSEKEYTLEKVLDDNRDLVPIGEDKRYILRTAVLPGNRNRSYLITSSLNYSAPCEGAGLFEFIMLRAVAYAAWRGVARNNAWHYLHATAPKERQASDPRISPKWSVGYERATGLCTILVCESPNTEALFLGGKPGYFVPKFST